MRVKKRRGSKRRKRRMRMREGEEKGEPGAQRDSPLPHMVVFVYKNDQTFRFFLGMKNM